MSTKASGTSETALKFGPQWIRALSDGNSVPPSDSPVQKQKLAQYRYGREEMLALFPKCPEMPPSLNEFDYLLAGKCQTPLALLPITEDEQHIWSRSVNSEAALRVSNKGSSGPGSTIMTRGGRGGSIDRGRGRGRGGYHGRGYSFEDEENSGGFSSRLRPIERSQSANEKDQRWEERDRRAERNFAGRLDDNSKQDGIRAPSENWRRSDKEDENGWRSSNSRSSDRFGGRGSWRNYGDRGDTDHKDKALQHNKDTKLNGPLKNPSSHPRQRSSSGHFWDDDTTGENIPEWSVDEDTTADVGTFDSSGAFLETKGQENNIPKEEVFMSDDEQTENKAPSPRAKEKDTKTPVKKGTTIKPPTPPSPSIPPPVASSNVQDLNEHVSKSLSSNNTQVPSIPAPVPLVQKSLLNVQKTTIPSPVINEGQALIEEDTFAHHKKATENMMAQWTQEDEQRVLLEPSDASVVVLPIHDINAYKWFYRDPQGQIQGPFSPNTMLEWYNGRFFTNELQIKRGCDEKFVQLGELAQMWNRIPFAPGTVPPPIRATPIATNLTTSFTQSTSLTNHIPLPVQYPQPDTTSALQQRLMQQIIFRHMQMEQTLKQMKQLEESSSLPAQRQNIIVQHLLAQQQQQQQIPKSSTNTDSVIDQVPNVPLSLLGLNVPSLAKNDLSLWGINQSSWTSGHPTIKAPSGGSIWDTDASIPVPIEVSELEKRMAAEEEEKQRIALEALKQIEEMKRLDEERKRKEEEKRKEDELKRKEEERILREIQKKQEEEKKRLEEIQRQQEQEKRRLEELKKEERRCEEIRRQEELKLEELRKQEEKKRLLAEQLRREEEERLRLEEERLRKEEERLEQKRHEEERRRHEEFLRLEAAQREKEELQKKLLWEQEQEKIRENERLQREALEEQEMLRREAEKEREQLLRKESENCLRFAEQKGPVWGVQPIEKNDNELSLADIQRIQEQKEREQKERLKFQQQLQQQQNMKQIHSNKNGLTWARKATENMNAVKSLVEIQMEEAAKMAQQQKNQKTITKNVPAMVASGVWGNSSQLNRASSAPVWKGKNDSFWDDALKSSVAQKPVKTNDSAFPTLSNAVKPPSNSNKSKSIRAKKDEDAVIKLFEAHRQPNDEFTSWCIDALSHLPSSVDVPTFVTFLMDVESPFEVHDYVRSYLGEGKEAKEFGKQFLERRSKHRNQTKQSPAEENMWGPAPAITPTVNKPPIQNDCDSTLTTKGKTKKKKNKMQKVDNSMLGFTVQPNPDRINIGEIDHVEGM